MKSERGVSNWYESVGVFARLVQVIELLKVDDRDVARWLSSDGKTSFSLAEGIARDCSGGVMESSAGGGGGGGLMNVLVRVLR